VGLEILLVLGSVLGFAGACLFLAAGGGSPSVKSWGTTLVVFAALMALLAPVMLLVAQPTVLAHDSYKGSVGKSQTNGPTSSFFGSNSTNALSATWGPSIGWYLSILLFLMLAISVALVPSSRPQREAVPGPPAWTDQRPYVAYPGSPGSPYAQPPPQPQGGYAQGPPAMQPPPSTYSQTPAPIYPPQAPPPPPPPPTSANGFCPYCGTGIVTGGSFCRSCGRPVVSTSPTVPPS
jgi:hypothetical protein